MSQPQACDPFELFPLLLSNDLHVTQEIKTVIQDNLNSARDPGFLNALLDFYIRTSSQNALDLLAGIREPLDKILMERLNDGIKAGHKLQCLTLLSHVVRHQPSWLHKIVRTPLFTSLINCLKMDTDIPVIMCGLLTVTTLLPMIPSLVGQFLPDIFSIFSHLTSWNLKKPGNVPDVYQLHLQVAVYALFHRLYGMYPWNFLQYLRTHYQKRSAEFNTLVLPMLERVRMHPLLVVGSADLETANARWRKMEVHDILMECARVSLDTTESARDDSFSYYPTERRGSKVKGTPGQGVYTSSPIVDNQDEEPSHKPLMQWDSGIKKDDADHHSLVSHEGSMSMFSPSIVCGLSTPPHSHPPSPTGSQLDVSLVSSTQYQCMPHLDTPLTTPRESPHPNAAAHLSSRMSSMSEGSVHSRGSRSSASARPSSRGKLPSVVPNPSGQLFRTVSAPVTPGYETRSLPVTPQKPQSDRKPSTHQPVTKQRCFIWDEDHLTEALTSNGMAACVKQEPKPEVEEGDELLFGKKRTESSVSLKDLPEVIKDLSNVVQRPREDDTINQEVSSFTGSPYDNGDLGSSTESNSRPNTTRSQAVTTTTATPPVTRKPTAKNMSEVSLHHIERTQSDPNAAYRSTPIQSEVRTRTSSFGNKIKNGFMTLRRGIDPDPPPITPQGFVPITNRSLDCLESPIQRAGALSTTSDAPSTPGPTQPNPLQMPYLHLFNLVLPTLENLSPAYASSSSQDQSPALKRADSCTTPGKTGTALVSGDLGLVALHSLYSPSQLLDRHLLLGNEIHDNQLTGLPLTSQESINWTHFGGSPPVDEIQILKGQLQLLHNQLLYERHKREVHAERNRRLLGKTHKAKALEESNAAMQDQLKLLDTEVKQLRAAFKLLRQENKQLAETDAAKDEIHGALLKKLQLDNDQMRDANEELQKLLVDHKLEVDKAAKELQIANARWFAIQQDLDSAKADVATNRHLKDEIARLNKELLLMGEANSKYQEKMEAVRQAEIGTEETEMTWAALKKDLAASQEALKRKTIQLEAAKARIGEMEATSALKDVAVAEQKRLLENVKSINKGKMEAMDAKYNALKKVNQRMEAHILKLTKSLRERDKDARRHIPSGRESRSTEALKSIEMKPTTMTTPTPRVSRSIEASKDDVLTHDEVDRNSRGNTIHRAGSPTTREEQCLSIDDSLSATCRDTSVPRQQVAVERHAGAILVSTTMSSDVDTQDRPSFNSPPLVFSDMSPFQRVQRSPRLSARHNSFTPSSRIPPLQTSKGETSQSCPDLDAGSSPGDAEDVGGVALEGSPHEGGVMLSATPPGAVVDTVAARLCHVGLASMVNMEASIEETDVPKH